MFGSALATAIDRPLRHIVPELPYVFAFARRHPRASRQHRPGQHLDRLRGEPRPSSIWGIGSEPVYQPYPRQPARCT